MMGDDESRFLFATTSGFGFVGKLGAMNTRNKSGKAVLSVPKGADVLPPQRVNDPEKDVVVAIGSDGKMAIPKASGKAAVKLQAVRILGAKNALKIVSGKRHTTLKRKDLEHYYAERGRRGLSLPRGFQKVADVLVE